MDDDNLWVRNTTSYKKRERAKYLEERGNILLCFQLATIYKGHNIHISVVIFIMKSILLYIILLYILSLRYKLLFLVSSYHNHKEFK